MVSSLVVKNLVVCPCYEIFSAVEEVKCYSFSEIHCVLRETYILNFNDPYLSLKPLFIVIVEFSTIATSGQRAGWGSRGCDFLALFYDLVPIT